MPKAVNRAWSKRRLSRKQLGIGRIGAGITALDIVDAEIVQHLRDQPLVLQREIDAVGLRAVAQRGVEQIEAFAAHACTSLPASVFFIVVLASHSSPIVTELRCSRCSRAWRKTRCAVSLASTVSAVAPRAPASFSSASHNAVADALPRRARMHIEHVDVIGALERSKADRRTLQRRDQRQLLASRAPNLSSSSAAAAQAICCASL